MPLERDCEGEPSRAMLAVTLERVRALAHDYGQAPLEERRKAAVDYLLEVSELLFAMGGKEDILLPLVDVIPYIEDPGAVRFEERRGPSTEPSIAMLARTVAAIDALIDCGMSEEAAAQLLSRQMLRAGAALPTEGGDPRGWQRLLQWRKRLRELKRPEAAVPVYAAKKKQLRELPRVALKAALETGSAWNLRQGR